MRAQKLKNFTMFMDGRGLAGKVTEVGLPPVKAKLEDHRAGGMDMADEYDMGLEKLEAPFTLAEFNPEVLALYGLTLNSNVQVTVRGHASDDDGNSSTIVAQMRGRLKEQDPGTWKPGESTELKGTITCRYYKLTINGRVIYEIDIDRMVRIVDGVDQLAAQRASLGV